MDEGPQGDHDEELDSIVVNYAAELEQSGNGDVRRRVSEWAIVFALALIYLTRPTPGHVFANDDFTAYVMHAANLAEGRPYSAIHYIPNPNVAFHRQRASMSTSFFSSASRVRWSSEPK